VPPTDTFLTVAEAAAQVRVSKMTIHRLINSGELRALRVGRSWRISRASWDAYLERAGG
jgi:excisionase family DNA binding protein